MKKTTIFKNALATLLLLCATGPLNGQEMVREFTIMHDDYSLVRETDRGEWLVYNYNSGRSIFSLVTDTTTSAPQMYLDFPEDYMALKILDFVIFQDTVYFCGLAYYDLNEDYVTAWGYFPLQGFPHDTVFIDARLYYMQYFNKIAVFSVDSSMTGLHVVMTCNNPSYSEINRIVDMVRISPNSFTSFDHNYDDYFKYYEDVEVTDNYVLFSYTQKVGFGHFIKTFVNYVKKPSSPGTTIFSNPVYRQKLFNSLTARGTLLEYCTNDAFVVAQPMYDSIYVFAFAMTTDGTYGYLGTIRFPKKFLYQSMKDVKYDKQSKILDILTVDDEIKSSQLYHLNPMLLGLGGTVYVHQFCGDLLNSLDVLRNNPNNFIASGHSAENSKLKLFRYQYYNHEECTDFFNLISDFFEYSEKPIYFLDELKGFKIIMEPLRSFVLEEPVKTRCGKK